MSSVRPLTKLMVQNEVSALRRLHDGILENDGVDSRAEFKDMMTAAFTHGRLELRELADDLGFSFSTVFRWLEGRSAPHSSLWPRVVDWVVAALGQKIEAAEHEIARESEVVLKSEEVFYGHVLKHAHQKSGSIPAEAMGLLKSPCTLDLAEFYNALVRDRAAGRAGVIRKILKRHNEVIDNALKDPERLAQLGWTESRKDRLEKAKFSAEQISRIIAVSSDDKILFEQSDLSKVMCPRAIVRGISEETTQKLIVCLSEYGFFRRLNSKTTMLVESTGILEGFYRQYVDEYNRRSSIADDEAAAASASFTA